MENYKKILALAVSCFLSIFIFNKFFPVSPLQDDSNHVVTIIVSHDDKKDETPSQPIKSEKETASSQQISTASGISLPPTTTASNHFTWPIPPHAPCKRPLKGRTREEGRWFDYSRDDFVLYTYSALVDDRQSLESGPVVRIIAISTDIAHLPRKPPMFCKFYIPISQEIIKSKDGKVDRTEDLVFSVPVEDKPERFVGMGWFLNGKTARETIYTCPLPQKKTLIEQLKRANHSEETFKALEAVATVKGDFLKASWLAVLVGETSDTNVTSCMPVEASPKPEKKKEFVLCVQVAFGGIDARRLLIWLELQRLLGVDQIGIYDQNVEKPAMEVLKFYAEQGLVDLRRSDYIPHGPQQYLLHGSPVINDCMYRHLHTHEHLLVYDLDEVILPFSNSSAKAKNFHDLLEDLRRVYGKGHFNYIFRNRYFFFDHAPDPNEPKQFDVFKFKMAAPLSSRGYSSKSMLSMQMCIQMHNHYCWGLTQTFKDQNLLDVSQTLASNQHYKKCHLGPECAKMIKESVHFDAMTPYKDILIKNVRKTAQELIPRFKSANLQNPFEELIK